MNITWFYGAVQVAVGILMGWIFVSLYYQQRHAHKEAQKHIQEQALQQAQNSVRELYLARDKDDRASRLYDKFRLFIEDMTSLGQSLDKSQASYCQAMNKLASGRGNLISQVEIFRSLGVEVKRTINTNLVQKAVFSEKSDRETNQHFEQPQDIKNNIPLVQELAKM